MLLFKEASKIGDVVCKAAVYVCIHTCMDIGTMGRYPWL